MARRRRSDPARGRLAIVDEAGVQYLGQMSVTTPIKRRIEVVGTPRSGGPSSLSAGVPKCSACHLSRVIEDHTHGLIRLVPHRKVPASVEPVKFSARKGGLRSLGLTR